MPQVHGAVVDALDYVRGVLEIEVNSATDNPLVFPDGAGVDPSAVATGGGASSRAATSTASRSRSRWTC